MGIIFLLYIYNLYLYKYKTKEQFGKQTPPDDFLLVNFIYNSIRTVHYYIRLIKAVSV